MRFKSASEEADFRGAHPELRAIASDLDAQLKRWGLPELTITDVGREPGFYGAMPRWSWHYALCAFDVRTREYTPEQLGRVLAWLQGRSFRNALKVDVVWEPNATRGAHVHVEVEDWEWRRRYEQKARAT